FRFTGFEGLASEAELQKIVAGAVGETLNFPQLQAVAESVTAHLKKKGWPLAQAYLPRQDVTNGAIEITILQGRIEKEGAIITKTPNVRLSERMIKKTVDGALPSDGGSP